MNWIYNYQLFLFDFDGILVNTEELHFKAYKKMCSERGCTLTWDIDKYFSYAMYSATALQKAIYEEFPALKQAEPDWNVLYREKKRAYHSLLHSEGVALMPGVEKLLIALDKANIKRCVVTHSPIEQVSFIREKNPILQSIPFWVTREDYNEPKPSSECYQKAISLYGEKSDQIIGFEDSPRGLQALVGTRAKAVFVTKLFQGEELLKLSEKVGREFVHRPSFDNLP